MLRLRTFRLLVLAVAVSFGGNAGCRSTPPDDGNENGNDNGAGPRVGHCASGVVECNTDSACNDGDPCTTDTCDGGCCENTPECGMDNQCNDGSPCTTDACENGCCENAPIDCDDELFCTGTELCDSDTGGCLSSGSPCAPNESCDEDSDECLREPPEAFGVSITGCPPQLGQGDSAGLVAIAAHASGVVTYVWELVGGTGILEDTTAEAPTFTATSAGEVMVRVTATDAYGNGTGGQLTAAAVETCAFTVTADDSGSKRSLADCVNSSTSTLVIIDVTAPGDAVAMGIVDVPPSGWAVSNISDGGQWDSLNRAIKWFFVAENLSWSVSYTATPPIDVDVVRCFTGRVNFDGVRELTTEGRSCIGLCTDAMGGGS